MASPMAVSDLVEGNFTCGLHFEGKSANESLLELTSAKSDKAKECAEKWLAASKQPERSVDARFLEGFHGDWRQQQDQTVPQEVLCVLWHRTNLHECFSLQPVIKL